MDTTARRFGTDVQVVQPDLSGWRVSWAGVWSGFLAVMGILLLLSSLGLAVGISAVGPNVTSEDASIGMGAGIWAGVSLLIALFVGGMVTTRISLVLDRTTAVLEGALIWVLTILATLYLATTGIGLLVSGASRLLGGAVHTLTAATSNVDPASLLQGSPDQVLARLKDPQTVRTVAAATGVPESEVRQVFADTHQKVEAARDNPAQVAADVRSAVASLASRAGGRISQAVSAAQPRAATTAWVTFAALIISLIAAVLGAATGQHNSANRRIA